jgi:hypothetical protein
MKRKKSGTVRVSYSLPRSVADDVSYCAERLGVSRSALTAELLEYACGPLSELLRETPKHPTPADVKRLRGASLDLVKTRVATAMEWLGDGGQD